MKTTMRARWTRIGEEWRANRRLRMAVLIALVVLSVNVIVSLETRKQALIAGYTSDLELQARLEGVSRQSQWKLRAKDAEARLEALHGQLPVVSGSGLAQAELQSWLTQLASSTGLVGPQVKVEDTLEVEGHPDLWQVLARLDGQLPEYGQATFLRAVSDGLPWIQVERLEIAEGVPARMGLTVRSYYRRGQAQAAVPEPALDPVPPPVSEDAADLAVP